MRFSYNSPALISLTCSTDPGNLNACMQQPIPSALRICPRQQFLTDVRKAAAAEADVLVRAFNCTSKSPHTHHNCRDCL